MIKIGRVCIYLVDDARRGVDGIEELNQSRMSKGWGRRRRRTHRSLGTPIPSEGEDIVHFGSVRGIGIASDEGYPRSDGW